MKSLLSWLLILAFLTFGAWRLYTAISCELSGGTPVKAFNVEGQVCFR